MRCYDYGGVALTTDIELPELVATEPHPGGIEVQTAGGDPAPATPPWVYAAKTRSGQRVYAVGHDGPSYVIEFADGSRFDFDPTRRMVRGTRAPATSPVQFRHLLLDQLLPRIRARMGALVLHASAASTGAGLIALLGDSGAGKSTLAGGLTTYLGLPVCDDAVIIEGSPEAATMAYAGLRLLPDSETALATGLARLGRTAASGGKVRFESSRPCPPRSQPLLGCVVLADDSTGGPRLLRLPPARAAVSILANSFALDPTEPTTLEHRLEQAAEVAATVPCFELHYPRDFGALANTTSLLARELALT